MWNFRLCNKRSENQWGSIIDNEEYEKVYKSNEVRAEKYYQELRTALVWEDVDYMENIEDRDNIDSTEPSQATLKDLLRPAPDDAISFICNWRVIYVLFGMDYVTKANVWPMKRQPKNTRSENLESDKSQTND